MSRGTKEQEQAFGRLAEFLRQNLDALDRSPEDVARELDLSPGFVRNLLAGRGPALELQHRPKPPQQTAPPIFNRLRVLFRKLTSRPVFFVVITLILGIGLSILATVLIGTDIDSGGMKVVVESGGTPEVGPSHGSGLGERLLWRIAAQVAIYGGVMILHLLCYFRWAMARVVLKGSLAVWLTLTVIGAIPLLLTPAGERGVQANGQPLSIAVGIVLTSVAFLVLTALYALFGLCAAVAGGYLRVRRVEALESKKTRQELLERLFEIEEKIKMGGASSQRRGGLADLPFVVRFREHPWLWGSLIAAIVGVLQVTVTGGIAALLGQNFDGSIEVALASLVIGAVGIVAHFFVAFFSGGLGRAILISLLFSSIGVLATTIPLQPFGFDWVRAQWPDGYIVTFLFALVLGALAGLASRIEARAAIDRLVVGNDPATLLSEMVQIQRKLHPTAASVCVMVVDAAKSSQMKATADPLVAEWSFREYQNLIERICERYGGSVHSTAGDGAVTAFPAASQAFKAAQALQTEIQVFNHKVNRLETPFRLRIGLHSGQVAGDIDKVQFTAVIDIAAHAEGSAPIGGIVVTEPVAEQLADERLAKMEVTVDGFPLYVALVPNLEE